ncbi:MAG: type III PLP-dependent enzyme [Alphaproteobacteria bacterium]|nr:type III PLP-dependent enzyme [Alphaproteobacteria bacterium]
MLTYQTPLDLVRDRLPEKPVACVRPERVSIAATWFQGKFPGEVLYAVKANPSPWALDAVYAAGLRWFDVASEAEVQLIASRYPDAKMAFMHPVKSRKAIERSYFEHGVRIFALDCEAELEKIVAATGGARDLTLVVRLSVSNADATYKLSGKFGIDEDAAPALLSKARRFADELGVSFHVGSQCMSPSAYRDAMELASRVIVHAGVTVDVVDVGGGFPSAYPGMAPPDLQLYMNVIREAFEDMPVLMNADLWCEPGRALVAESTSILARVELVKDGALHINDGSYGNLFDAAHCKWPFPVKALRADGEFEGEYRDYRLYGPTCDSLDAMEGPFHLPADIREGDYIEIGMLGAYGVAMTTRFNGYGDTDEATVKDAPWASMYGPVARPARTGKVVQFRARRKRAV